MSDTPNTVTTLNGLFKVTYADKLADAVPDFALLQKRIKFIEADKETGNYYAQPVNLASEQGFTYLGSSGAVATLGDAIAGAMKEAQVQGSELVLRSQLSYGALARASKAGPKAFKRASAWKVEDMNNSIRKRLELSMLYGRDGLGTVSTNTVGALVITDATWAGGTWAGLEGAQLEAWTATSDTATQHDTTLTISAVDFDLKTVTVTGTSTSVAPGDILYFKGSRTATTNAGEMAGLNRIITNTGTLFNIAANTYALWKGTTVSSVGQPSFDAIQDGVSRAVNKGMMGKGLVLVSPKHWAALSSDQAALRVFDQSYSSKSVKNGAESITFYGPNGELEILSHPFCRDGDAFIVPEECLMRLGAVELSFGVPGMDEQFFTLVSAKNAVELQCMADQAIFCEKPAYCVKLTGLTYA